MATADVPPAMMARWHHTPITAAISGAPPDCLATHLISSRLVIGPEKLRHQPRCFVYAVAGPALDRRRKAKKILALATLSIEAVSRPAKGHDQISFRPKLLSQTPDIDIHDVGHRVFLRAPNGVQDPLPAQSASRVFQ